MKRSRSFKKSCSRILTCHSRDTRQVRSTLNAGSLTKPLTNSIRSSTQIPLSDPRSKHSPRRDSNKARLTMRSRYSKAQSLSLQPGPTRGRTESVRHRPAPQRRRTQTTRTCRDQTARLKNSTHDETVETVSRTPRTTYTRLKPGENEIKTRGTRKHENHLWFLCLFVACQFNLEVELQAQLNLPRIAGREELTKLADLLQLRNAGESHIGRQAIRNRLEHVVEHRVIEDVVELGAELQLVTLTEVEVLRQVRIGVELAREAERRPRRITNLARQRRAERKWVERVRNAAGRIRRDGL